MSKQQSNSARIKSILNTPTIGILPKGVTEFKLSALHIQQSVDYNPQSKLRLGKEIEKVVAALIKASSNYKIVAENSQIMDGKTTIGELDFIVEDCANQSTFHLELGYKFYVYDPNVSQNEVEKWIGPNRKDSLIEKLTKLENKQFPLLKNPMTQTQLTDFDCQKMPQQLCFLAHLFVPFSMLNAQFEYINTNAIAGYWVNFDDFIKIQTTDNLFYLPQKSEWGIHPQYNETWQSKTEIIDELKPILNRQFSPLCWVKTVEGTFKQCFIVWW